jgi:hypothetical protein
MRSNLAILLFLRLHTSLLLAELDNAFTAGHMIVLVVGCKGVRVLEIAGKPERQMCFLLMSMMDKMGVWPKNLRRCEDDAGEVLTGAFQNADATVLTQY